MFKKSLAAILLFILILFILLIAGVKGEEQENTIVLQAKIFSVGIRAIGERAILITDNRKANSVINLGRAYNLNKRDPESFDIIIVCATPPLNGDYEAKINIENCPALTKKNSPSFSSPDNKKITSKNCNWYEITFSPEDREVMKQFFTRASKDSLFISLTPKKKITL